MPMRISFVDKTGTTGVIRDDFTIIAEAPVSKEVRLFVKGKKRAKRDPTYTITDPPPSFLLELFIQTSVKKVEPNLTDDFTAENHLGYAL